MICYDSGVLERYWFCVPSLLWATGCGQVSQVERKWTNLETFLSLLAFSDPTPTLASKTSFATIPSCIFFAGCFQFGLEVQGTTEFFTPEQLLAMLLNKFVGMVKDEGVPV